MAKQRPGETDDEFTRRKRRYANAWYHRNSKSANAKQKKKRERGPGREKFLAYMRGWNRDHAEEHAEHNHRMRQIETRIGRRVADAIRAEGLSITSHPNAVLWWQGPGMEHERELEALADALLGLQNYRKWKDANLKEARAATAKRRKEAEQ